MNGTKGMIKVGQPNIGRDTFSKARSEEPVNCQLYSELFEKGEEPLQREGNRKWRPHVKEAARVADTLCEDCPIRRECYEGAQAGRYTGIAGGAVWRNGKVIG